MAPSVNKSSSRATLKQNLQKKRQDQIAQGIITPKNNFSQKPFDTPATNRPVDPPMATTRRGKDAAGNEINDTDVLKPTGLSDNLKQLGKNFVANIQKGGTPLGQGPQIINDAGEVTNQPSLTLQDTLVASAGASPGAFGGSASAIAKGAQTTEQTLQKTPITQKSLDEIAESGIAKSITEKKVGNYVYQTNQKGQIIGRTKVNAKSATLTDKFITKIVGGKYPTGKQKIARYLIGASIGAYGLGLWAGLDNAKGVMNTIGKDVLKTNDPALIAEYFDLQEEIFRTDVPGVLLQLSPIIGTGINFKNAIKANNFQAKLLRQMKSDFEEAASNQGAGTDFTSANPNDPSNFNNMRLYVASQISEKETQDEITRSNNWINARLTYDKLAREAEVKARNEDAAFWREEKRKTIAMERAEREAQAEFWAAYRKRIQEMGDDNAPSSLTFGLLQ